jgi:adenylate kinase
VLSDGKVAELAVDIPPLHLFTLTTELAANSNYLEGVDEEELHFASGIIENAAKVVDEFRAKYHLEPMKVLVVGPPSSGYERVAERIAARIGAPLIDPVGLVAEVRKETTAFGDEIRQSIEDNENRVSDEIICKVAHKRMKARACRNYGWVMSGFCDSVERAQAIYDVGEEEEPSPHFEHIPTHVIVLDAKDVDLERRAAETTDDSEAFGKALRRYRRHNTGEENIFQFFDDRAIPSLICDAFGEMDAAVTEFLGPKRDFGRPLEEIEAERAEIARVAKEKEDAEQARRKEQAAAETRRWDDDDSIFGLSVARLEREDEQFLAGKAKVLEDVLEATVLDSVARGILGVARARPEDPIEALAKFLFAEHRKQKQYH